MVAWQTDGHYHPQSMATNEKDKVPLRKLANNMFVHTILYIVLGYFIAFTFRLFPHAD